MTFSGLLASWFLLVKMCRSPLQPLVPHQGDSSPQPHWALCPISVSSNPASIHLIASLPSFPGDVPTMMSPPHFPQWHIYVTGPLPVPRTPWTPRIVWLVHQACWVGVILYVAERKLRLWAVDSLTNFRDSPGIHSSQSGSISRLHPLSGSLELLLLGPVHNLLQNMTQMNTSTRQKQTHRHRRQTYHCQGGGEKREGWVESLELANANYYL